MLRGSNLIKHQDVQAVIGLNMLALWELAALCTVN